MCAPENTSFWGGADICQRENYKNYGCRFGKYAGLECCPMYKDANEKNKVPEKLPDRIISYPSKKGLDQIVDAIVRIGKKQDEIIECLEGIKNAKGN